MPFRSNRGDLLQRALEGVPVTDAEIASLLATVERIPALSGPSCSPRPQFVQDLGVRLRTEALALPVRPAPSPRRAAPSAGGARPVVLVVGRGIPRILAGVTATVLAAGAVVGVASRGALPGGALYPVKQLLDSAAVHLAGSDYDRGLTLLSQGQEHISEAHDLVDSGAPQAARVDEALGNAYDAVSAGQRTLVGVYDRDHNQQALLAARDFSARAVPQLQALGTRVPAASRPELQRLLGLLQLGDQAVARKTTACGAACPALQGAGHPGTSPTDLTGIGVPSGPGVSVTVPTGAPTDSGGPGVSGGGSVQVGGGGGTASLPGGVGLPLPGLSLGGGSASSTSSSPVGGLGSSTIGLPGGSLPVPPPMTTSIGVPSVSTPPLGGASGLLRRRLP